MDNAELTKQVVGMVRSLATIEANTSCIPKLREDCEHMWVKVHDNTEFRQNIEPMVDDIKKNISFRKSYEKIKWLLIASIITASVGSIVALVFAFANKGG